MKLDRNKLRRTGVAYAFLAPSLLVLLVFFFVPVAQGVRLSFFQIDPYVPEQAKFVGGANFARILKDPEFRSALVNSFTYLLVVPVIIAMSLALALLVEPRMPFVNVFRAAYYVPVVTTMVVVGIAWRFIFGDDSGLLNRLLLQWGLIRKAIPWLTDGSLALWTVMSVTVWKGLGYYMVVFIGALRNIPTETIEAAIVDGAKPSQVFWRIKFPMLWPTISLVAVLSSIAALQVFDEIYVMTGGKVREARTLVYYVYETGFSQRSGAQDYGYASAMAVALFGVLLVFTWANLAALRRGGYQGEG